MWFSIVFIVDFEQAIAEGMTNVNTTQNEYCSKINTTQKHSNPRKQNKFRRNPKCIEKRL